LNVCVSATFLTSDLDGNEGRLHIPTAPPPIGKQPMIPLLKENPFVPDEPGVIEEEIVYIYIYIYPY
jgi:hypothetical protein